MKHVQVHISTRLDESEWNVLRMFCEKVRRLMGTRIGSGQCDIKGNINYERDKGLTFKAQLPPEEQIAEFLMAFRFFYLEKEPTHFPKVLGVIGRHTDDQEARTALKLFGQQWRDCLFGKAMGIEYNDKPITSALLLDLWFNAHYFHQDEDKERELRKLIEGFSEPFAKYMLLDSAMEATKVVYKVYDGLKEIVESHFGKGP